MMPAVRSQPESSALATDLYEYTMAAGYFLQGMQEVRATFELFFRQLPVSRNFLISCGQELALDFISRWRITDDELAYLRSLPVLKSVPDGFFRYLKRLRFTGDVWAMPEGTPVFPNEPILRVSAPIIEAQLMETALLAFINHSTAIASKA
ncbi:MAG: nicotinate phosphoribosyltransferase, partial [Planctomycetales bacterium 4484_113]